MEDKILAVYEREFVKYGFHKANTIEQTVKIVCTITDNRWYRENHVKINGDDVVDTLNIERYNKYGKCIYVQHFYNRNEANKTLNALLKNIGGFKRIV